MKLELAPVALRIRPSTLDSYKVYMDSLIALKLREFDRVKKVLTNPKPLTASI